MRSKLLAFLRRMIPEGTALRRGATVAFAGLRGSRAEIARNRAQRDQVKPSTLSYAHWLVGHRATMPVPSDTAAVSTLVVVLARSARIDGEPHPLPLVTGARVVLVEDGAAASSVLEGASESTVVVVRAGDRLSPAAVPAIAHARQSDPTVVAVTFDSDRLDSLDGASHPFFRPKWSPSLVLGRNAVGFAAAYDRAWLAARLETFDARSLWAAQLDASLTSASVAHVPLVLLSERHQEHRRIPGPDDAAMVARRLRDRGVEAVAVPTPTGLRIEITPSVWPSVSVVAPTRHHRANLERLFESLLRTEYPGEWDLLVMDNGGQDDERDAWYEQWRARLPIAVRWWTESPFNYSRVNNAGVAATEGAVVLLLNDDTEIVDAHWLQLTVGTLSLDGVGSVGWQHRRGDGCIQHGGVMLGPGGFADNLFAGMPASVDTLIGPTDLYRDTLAVTGACVAIARDDWERIGGLDERFELCGSDVVLGLDLTIAGLRSTVIPFDGVRHYESTTRGSDVPQGDFFASYWRYLPWLQGGDPYVSKNVSPLSSTPKLRRADEASPVERSLAVLGRPFMKIAQSSSISHEATSLLASAAITDEERARTIAERDAATGERPIALVNWYLPEIDTPFFGGVNTALRIAAMLTRDHGIRNRFVFMVSQPNEPFFRSALAAAFPELADSEIHCYDATPESVETIPPADAAVATLWLTAIHVARAPDQGRRFYLIQDYEPSFYPASSMFAFAESSYRLGLFGIGNTPSMGRTYAGEYRGKGIDFLPAVDRSIYHAIGRREKAVDEPVTIFAYARDHFRNCWELAFAALTEIKRRHGDGVRILTAGARYLPPSADFVDLGLMDYRATGRVYRETDIGLSLQISRHPSYLPLELMACGVPMVAFDSPWFDWIFEDGANASLADRSVESIVEHLDRLVTDAAARKRLSAGALATIDERFSDWSANLAGIHPFLVDPGGVLDR